MASSSIMENKNITDAIECPICLETMNGVIKQCLMGHSICSTCTSKIKKCPLCRSFITAGRNYQLEKLIANLKDVKMNLTGTCKYRARGCNMHIPDPIELKDHELECKKRIYCCEGMQFIANWDCEWNGCYYDILKHFKNDHPEHFWMELRNEFFQLPMNLKEVNTDIQIIPYKNGKELFWYKQKVDPWKEKAYWLFQYIGPAAEAHKYYYTFAVKQDAFRKLKVKELCESDIYNANGLFNGGKCVTIPFSTLKNYINVNCEISVKFTIGEVKDLALQQTPVNNHNRQNNTLQSQESTLQAAIVDVPNQRASARVGLSFSTIPLTFSSNMLQLPLLPVILPAGPLNQSQPILFSPHFSSQPHLL